MMRGMPAASAAVCAVGMTCAALWCPPDPPPRDAAAGRDDPDPAVVQLNVRSAAKDWIAREVAAGRMALPDAAARFGWLNALPPAAYVYPLNLLPDGGRCTECELLALQVVRWVERLDSPAPPGRVGELTEAALAQFRRARAEGLLDRLPEVPAADRARLLEQARAEAAGWYGRAAVRVASVQ